MVPESKDGNVYLLDMGEPFRIVDLARRFIQQHGLTAVIEGETADAIVSGGGNMPIVFSGVRPGEKLFKELVFDAQCMRPTRHSDINIWALPEPDPQYVDRRALANSRQPLVHAIRRPWPAKITGLVPESQLRVAA